MYLHIGGRWIVSLNEIVAILNVEKSSKSNKEFYETVTYNKKLIEVSSIRESKTCIITSDKVYLTSISANTLTKRIENY
ncbi:extracellular matrix regulator RemB [Desulfitibacter alkalitolerans]|uniref:extracellular matrix regulator RemB n=1 Tax=Desulfitibacter alkalitolerans TaxID=264641 RepID=UPI000489C4E5|nr:extracellular matrix/biofilm biosynthesis regulator RemA family protein [Desulfitibacter alkalitolerans]